MKARLEDTILDTSNLMKEAGAAFINHAGKLVALAITVIAAALTFTDIRFMGFCAKDSLPSLLLLIASSYAVYFSLEDAGEHLGETTDEYLRARERYDELRERICGEDVEELREFCNTYSARELESRRRNLLLYLGVSEAEIADGSAATRAVRAARRRIMRMKPVFITPRALLSRERFGGHSELERPERRKLLSLIIKLLPSTVCMAITVSVILTVKDGLDAADILTGILKLSALPVVGFKGYSQGYSYTKHRESGWLETKSNIIESFISTRKSRCEVLDKGSLV